MPQPWSRQYLSAVYYGNEEQKRLALKTRERAAERAGQPVTTDVLPLGTFYRAEDYHQKYRLRCRRDLLREFKAMYPTEADFVNSTAAARVNGFLGGNGSPALLEKEIESYGLSPAGAASLREVAKRKW